MISARIIITHHNFEFSRKITKIVIYVLQQNSDDERSSQKAEKLADFDLLRLQYFKFQIPTAWGLIVMQFSTLQFLYFFKI